MDFMFTEEQKELRRRVRKFAEERLAPLAPEVDESLQIHGGIGLIKGTPIERIYWMQRSLRIYEGASEIQRITIARSILREK